jgi:signal transduction histidine kinase
MPATSSRFATLTSIPVTRIARELHDSLLQGFRGLMFRLQAVGELLPERPGAAAESLDAALRIGDEAIGEGRDAVQNLRSATFEEGDVGLNAHSSVMDDADGIQYLGTHEALQDVSWRTGL